MKVLARLGVDGVLLSPAWGSRGWLLSQGRLHWAGCALLSTFSPNVIVVDLPGATCSRRCLLISRLGCWRLLLLYLSGISGLSLTRALMWLIKTIFCVVSTMLCVHILKGIIRCWCVAMWALPSAVAAVAGAGTSLAESVDALAFLCFLLSDCGFGSALLLDCFLEVGPVSRDVGRYFSGCLLSYLFSFNSFLNCITFVLDNLCDVRLLEYIDWEASHFQWSDHGELRTILIHELLLVDFQLRV